MRHDDAESLNALQREMAPMQRHLILIAVSMGSMLHSMAMTSVSVVLPQMQGTLSAGPDQISWVLTLAVIGSVVATPLAGWMVDRLGWRSVMMITVAGFGLSTILCATAQSLPPLLFYRTLQGAFGAPIIAVTQAILLAVYPKEQVAWSQSAWGIATVLGQAMAPVLGGYLADTFDWRWAFWYLVPLTVVSLAMVIVWIPDRGAKAGTRFDWISFIGLSIAVTGLQLTMDRGERLDWFESPEILTYSIGSAIGFLFFLGRCFGHSRPFIDLSLFKDVRFTLGTVMIILFGMANFLPNWIFPAIMGGVQGYPESTVGWILCIRGLGLLIGLFVVSATAGPYPRTTTAVGFLAAGLCGFQGIFFTLDTSLGTLFWAAGFQGFGTALMWTPIIMVAFSGLSPSQMAQGSGLFHLLRQLSTSMFVAVSVAIYLRSSAVVYSEKATQVSTHAHGLVLDKIWDVESSAGLVQLSAEVDRQSQMVGYVNVFMFYTIVCVLGAILSYFCKPKADD